MLMAISIMGCDNAKDYSGEYNFETDDQYSYATSIVSWKKYQSDGNGQYIWKMIRRDEETAMPI